MRLRVAVGLLGAVHAAACGRVDFDPRDDPFPVDTGGCTLADAGPFVEVAAFASLGSGYGVWASPPFVLAADTTGGLHNLRFDGTSFARVDGMTFGWVEAVWSDGPIFYVGAPGTGLAVVEMEADGTLQQRTQNTGAILQARRGWVDGGTVYVPSGGDGLYAFTFDGTSLVQIGSPTATMGWSQGVWARDSRIMLADADTLRVLAFDGVEFTDIVSPDTRHPGTTRVWSDGTTFFVASADGATAFRLVDASLVELDTFGIAGGARDVWSDGRHVFLAGETAGVVALAFRDERFALVDQAGDSALGVVGDGSYVYVNDPSGVRAYAGFACHSW